MFLDDYERRETGRRTRIGWQVLVFLLGAEVTILLVWLWSGIEFGGDPRFDGRQWSEPVKALLEIVPLLTILVALRLGWIERRPQVVGWLIGFALVGPVLFAASPLTTGLSYDHLGAFLRISTWAATPACTAAAAGLVAALGDARAADTSSSSVGPWPASWPWRCRWRRSGSAA